MFSVLILLMAGFQGASAQTCGQAGNQTFGHASAQTSGQPVTNPTTPDTGVTSEDTGEDTGPVSAGADNRQTPSSTAGEQQESETGSAPQSEAKTAPPEKSRRETGPYPTAEVAGGTWLDQTHKFVEKNLCEPAVWFDNFFGEDRVLEDVRPGVFTKWRNAARWTEGYMVDYIGDFNLQVRLPELEKVLKKARLLITSGSGIDQFTSQPGQPVNPGVDPETGTRPPIIGIRLDLFKWFRSFVSFDTGIKIRANLDPFARMRYQYTKPFGEVYLFRFTENALWRYIEHFTETGQIDLEKKITTFTLLRWSNYATYEDNKAGITLNTGVSLITQLTPKSAISYDTSMWGVNHPEWSIQNYRVGSRYRLNFYRPWLFFELGPEVTWPKEASGPRNPRYAVMAALEIQFGE